MISQSEYNKRKRELINSYGGYITNRQVMKENGWTAQEADNYLNDVADQQIKDQFAGRDINKGLEKVNSKYWNPKMDKIREQRLSTRKVRSDKGKKRKFLGLFGKNMDTLSSFAITLSEFKKGRGKDKKKRKMREPSLENHIVKGLKYGAGIGGGLGALGGAAYGTMLAPGAGTLIGAGYGGVSGALGGAIDGALISLPVYGVNRYRYNKQNSKGNKVPYKR